MRGKHSSEGLMANGGDKGDMMNLLDSTDSDVEWLSLPPLKGKKPKKKKSSRIQKDPGCSLWSFMKIFLLFSLVGVVVLLCVVCVWLSSQINDITERLEHLESKSAVSVGDLEKLYQQMSSVNRSLAEHTKTLDALVTNISVVNGSVTQMSTKVDHVTEGLKSAPELKQLPDKLQVVSQSLASLGADVSGLKETVPDLMKSTGDRLDNLTKQILELASKQASEVPRPSDSTEVSPDLANKLEKLSQQIVDVNSTVFTQMSALIKSNSQHEERLLQLENVSRQLAKNMSSISTEHTSISSDHASMTDDYTSDQFKSSVTSIMKELLATEGPVPSSDQVAGVMANITTVLDNLKEVEAKYIAVETDPKLGNQTGGYVTLQMFQTLGDGFQAKIESLNTSFITLKGDVSAMSDLLTRQANTVSNLTHQVEATKTFMSLLQQKLENSVPMIPSEETKTTEKRPVTVKLDTQKPVGSTASPAKKVSESPAKSGTTGSVLQSTPAVEVPTILNYDDLELNFYRWDRQGTGNVDPKILPDYLGPNAPSEEVLKPFDEDNNGLYSLKELAKAFGFIIPTTPATSPMGSTKSSQPPR